MALMKLKMCAVCIKKYAFFKKRKTVDFKNFIYGDEFYANYKGKSITEIA